jgi:cell division transport system permease protein
MSLASIFMVAASITVFGAFVLLGINLRFIGTQLEEQCKIRAYFSPGTNIYYAQKVRGEIEKIYGVKAAELITKEKSLEEVKDSFGEKKYLLDSFDKDNPFRDYYKVTLSDISLTDDVSKKLAKITGINEVASKEDIAGNIINFTYFLKYASFIFVIFLCVITVFIISNTIRLMMFARRKEINIQKFVGATNWFIRWPYIIEGFIIGLIGSSAACAIIFSSYALALGHIGFFVKTLRVKTLLEVMPILAPRLIILGCAIGVLGSFVSIKKYLRV